MILDDLRNPSTEVDRSASHHSGGDYIWAFLPQGAGSGKVPKEFCFNGSFVEA